MATPQATVQLTIETFRKLSPINGLREESLQQLFKRAQVLVAPAGTSLFNIGSNDSDSYFVLKGEIELQDASKTGIRTIKANSPEALHRLAHQVPRKVAGVCKSNVEYLRLDSGLLDVMLTWDQTGSFEVDEIADDQSDSGDWMTRLLQMKAFQKVPPANLQSMFMRLQPVEFKAGQTVIQQDDEGDFFYVMISGRAIVTREAPTSPKPIRLAELDAGSCFGEEALISDDKRNATIRMLEDGSLMRLSKDDFRSLLTAPLSKDISYAQAQEKVAAGEATWLDVRLPSEYKNRHLDGALNVPLFMLRPKLPSLDKSNTYIVYCDSGRRSSVAAFVLTQKGYEVFQLADGIPEDA